MIDIIHREFVYLWYYFTIQFEQIFPYWVIGMLLGSAISVFVKEKIHSLFSRLQIGNSSSISIFCASILGILSPLCMYGTIPLAASFYRAGVKDDILAAFMMSSILLNPQLIIYSAALGKTALIIRVLSCFLCGSLAGILIKFIFKETIFFNFNGFEEPKSKDVDPNIIVRFLKNLGRNIKATGLYVIFGVLLSALFQRYVPADIISIVFGGNEAFGVLMAATIGVPLYACGGGTIPLLMQWLSDGMSMGSATAFMITGPATKITNLGALKIVLGLKHFIYYIVYIMLFSLMAGWFINLMIV